MKLLKYAVTALAVLFVIGAVTKDSPEKTKEDGGGAGTSTVQASVQSVPDLADLSEAASKDIGAEAAAAAALDGTARDDVVAAWGEPDGGKDGNDVWVWIRDDLNLAGVIEIGYDESGKVDVKKTAVNIIEDGVELKNLNIDAIKDSEAYGKFKAAIAKVYTEENKEAVKQKFFEFKTFVGEKLESGEISLNGIKDTISDGAAWMAEKLDNVDLDGFQAWLSEKLKS